MTTQVSKQFTCTELMLSVCSGMTLLILWSLGLLVPVNQDIGAGKVKDEDMKLMEYKPPGPPVWIG